ncbi:hypothetical protein QBC32DRAFT_376216 [Pseudoneurospora amorphoporcata]|uniref:Nephrocystin 3-like N-terminal domain-containing protein n=1 Tax=Pseudoneurospora amorphoporcata TaxID=241081 RepID=A0AAN6SE98_9PEZI|nr:hypothetical protein QBC32DRAFT_376216 [Pseudoneurospora amorphoporcata]
MDPLSILSIAASVVQFVDFGSRVLQETINAKKNASGTVIARVVTLGKISGEVTTLTQAISEKTARLSKSGHSRSIIEMSLIEQCRRCSEMSGEVLQGVRKLTGRGVEMVDFNSERDDKQCKWTERTKLGSFRAALRLIWESKKIEEIEETMKQIKSDLMFAMITHMWEQSLSGSDALNSAQPVSNQAINARQFLAQQLSSTDAQEAFRSLIPQSAESKPDEKDFETTPDKLPSLPWVTDTACIHALLSSLRFGCLGTRAKAITTAYQSTFEWIYGKSTGPTDGPQHTCPDFAGWLENDPESVYWITGKPGSGKSTMMKYLVENSRTTSHLKKWSDYTPVHIIWFYSWNAGDDSMQKSQEGLLRTLLYQILEAAPQLASQILPARWAVLKLFGSKARRHLPSWTWRELFDSIMALDLETVSRSSKLAIFIDGLDEFEGDDRDHEALIGVVKKFHSCSGIKVCVSSRPWNTFRDAFHDCPQLRMETLTQTDMTLFVNGSFNRSPAFRDLYSTSPNEASELMSTVIDKAKGVFLWVSIVTNVIIEGLRDGERIESLRRKIDELPSDLGRLYTSLWRGIKPEYKPDGARLLVLFETFHQGFKFVGPKGLTAERLWLADGDSPVPNAQRIIRQIVQNLERRLASRTRNILEVSPSGVVDYLHRTARDWIHNKEYDAWRDITQWQPVDFDPHLGLLIATAATAADPKAWGLYNHSLVPWYRYYGKSWKLMAQCFYHASRMTVHSPVSCKKMAESLDSLAGTLITLCSTRTRECPMPFWASSSTSRPDRLYGFGDSDDIIWRLIYGAGDCTFLREFGPLIEGAKEVLQSNENQPWLDPKRNRSVRRIQDIIAFDPQERYNLLKDILQKMRESPQKAAGFEKKLRPLHKQIITDITRGRKMEFSQPVTISFQSNGGSNQEKTIPYGHAVAELLEHHGVGNPLRGWWRRKSWQWSTAGANKSQRSLTSPTTPSGDFDRSPSSDDSDIDSVHSVATTVSYG